MQAGMTASNQLRRDTDTDTDTGTGKHGIALGLNVYLSADEEQLF